MVYAETDQMILPAVVSEDILGKIVLRVSKNKVKGILSMREASKILYYQKRLSEVYLSTKLCQRVTSSYCMFTPKALQRRIFDIKLK